MGNDVPTFLECSKDSLDVLLFESTLPPAVSPPRDLNE